MLTVFQCITMEGWTAILYWVKQEICSSVLKVSLSLSLSIFLMFFSIYIAPLSFSLSLSLSLSCSLFSLLKVLPRPHGFYIQTSRFCAYASVLDVVTQNKYIVEIFKSLLCVYHVEHSYILRCFYQPLLTPLRDLSIAFLYKINFSLFSLCRVICYLSLLRAKRRCPFSHISLKTSQAYVCLRF